MHQSSDEYEKTDLVGKGSFGFVYKAIHRPTRQIVAVKILSLDVAEQELIDVQQEIALLSQLKAAEGVNVTKYHGAFMKGPQLWIIMDYCSGGSVRTLMKPGRIGEKYLTIIVRETVSALAFIHKFGVIHRDVKAANILVGNDGRVQLCDFGVSALVQGPQTKRTTFVGTPWWMAPEVILENQTYNYKADIWSLGITILEIANGHPPYHDQEPMRALLMIPRQPPSRLEGGDWSQALRDFVSNCLCELPDDRMSADELSKQKLIKNVNRVQVSVLRDLVLRLEQWQKMGNVRNSLISGPNGLDILGEAGGNKDDEITWDFDENAEVAPYTKGHASKDSFTSFLSLDSNETVKAAAPTSTTKPIYTGTDHPLLQLFAIDNPAGNGGIAMQTPAALQPAFQPAPSNFRSPAPTYKSPSSTRPASPEPLMTIDLPSFDDINDDMFGPSGMSPAPLTQIELPSDDSFQTMRTTSTPLSQASVIPSEPSAPMLAPSGLNKADKLSSGRAQRSERGAHIASKSADIPPTQFAQGPTSPSKKNLPQTPEDSKKSIDIAPVSAPSSPPRSRAKFSHATPASSISNTNANATGRKVHHLPSLSAPQVSYREGPPTDQVPPVPSISDAAKNRSAESTPLSSKPRIGVVDPDSKPPVPTVVTSGINAAPSSGPTASGAHGTPRATGFKRADLSLKLPAMPHHGIEIANSQFPHSPGGRFLSPLMNSSAFGSQTPTPTAASHAQSFHLPATIQQHQIVQTDPWGMPLNVTLNPNSLFPSATNEEVHAELTKLLSLLDTSLGVFAGGLKQYQNQVQGQPGPVSTSSAAPATPPITVKRVKKPRSNQDSKQSDTEGFVSESN